MTHPAYHDPSEGSAPLPQENLWLTKADADARVRRAFWRGFIFGYALSGIVIALFIM